MSGFTVQTATAWLKGMVVTNWPTKVTALVLSAVLWAVVEAKQPTTQLVPVRLEVTPPSGHALADPLPPVQALYAGPASELIKLYAAPPVIHYSLRATDSLIELEPGDLAIARDIEATAQDVQPRSIPVRLERRGSDTARARAPVRPAVTERVLMGVPVSLPFRFRELMADPLAVAVTVRGPAARLANLTRDSLYVGVPDLPAQTGQYVRTTVTAPAGLDASVTPDSVRLVERPRG